MELSVFHGRDNFTAIDLAAEELSRQFTLRSPLLSPAHYSSLCCGGKPSPQPFSFSGSLAPCLPEPRSILIILPPVRGPGMELWNLM